mgnify:CR=1 FL=1|tara:strand:+ start:281 stop:514 length:234 start_codon:yes stop_codon:yes gene_type:complete
MITDITKFIILANKYVWIHAIKEENGEKNVYKTEFPCGFEEEDEHDVRVLMDLQYNQETFDYIDSLDVEWSLLDGNE